MFNGQQLQNLANATTFLSSLYNNNPLGTPQQKREIVTVNGYQDALNFKLEKGESIALIDANADVLYLKECDDIGKSTLKVFECIDKTDEYSAQPSAGVGKEEIAQLRKEFADLKTYIMQHVGEGKDNGKHNAKQTI